MTISVQIPEDLASAIMISGRDPARAVLEALALEGYRQEYLSESDIRRLLGFATRMQVHGFLKEHGMFLHYSVEDLEHDTAEALETARRHQAEKHNEPVTELHAG